MKTWTSDFTAEDAESAEEGRREDTRRKSEGGNRKSEGGKEPSDSAFRLPPSALASTSNGNRFPEVISWNTADRRRVTPIPPDHWLLIEDEVPFRATLSWGERREHEESVPMGECHIRREDYAVNS